MHAFKGLVNVRSNGPQPYSILRFKILNGNITLLLATLGDSVITPLSFKYDFSIWLLIDACFITLFLEFKLNVSKRIINIRAQRVNIRGHSFQKFPNTRREESRESVAMRYMRMYCRSPKKTFHNVIIIVNK